MFHQVISAGLIRDSKPRRKFSLSAYIALWRQRRALNALEPEQLRDIGLAEEAAKKEAKRALWDVPNHWMR
ncbi:MAG: DUF1127 domain-containing protein [Mangrovicoccus sp.]|nr:DUF1127 domain-containing protein [Mangrovicoccus sp.]